MAEPVLSAEGLAKRYGRDKVLEGVTFGAFARKLVGIVGEIGSGKSTPNSTPRVCYEFSRLSTSLGFSSLSGRLLSPGLAWERGCDVSCINHS